VSRRLGPYAPLSATYASDDAIIEAGEAAELLFCRGLAFCSTSNSDGYITDAQLVRFVGVGMRDAKKRAEKLAAVGLWERVQGGYIIRSWLDWNASSVELGRAKKKDRERKAALTPAVRKAVYERDGNACRYCGAETDLCIDHIKPQASGGDHDPENLQTLCQPCNWRKGTRDATGLSRDQARAAFAIDYGKDGPKSREQSRENHGNPVSRARSTKQHSTTQNSTELLPVAVAPAADITVNQRSKRLTDAYAAIEPMCKWPAVNGIVKKAIEANRWSDQEIYDALGRLAKESRSVTVDSLRTELNGFTPRTNSNIDGFRNLIQKFEAERIGGAQ
jgi:hypothetical protein